MQGVIAATRLCGLCRNPSRIRFEVSEFGYDEDKRACPTCREKLRARRAAERHVDLLSRPVKTCHGSASAQLKSTVLPVLTPPFKESELTPRAACRVFLREWRSRCSR